MQSHTKQDANIYAAVLVPGESPCTATVGITDLGQ